MDLLVRRRIMFCELRFFLGAGFLFWSSCPENAGSPTSLLALRLRIWLEIHTSGDSDATTIY